MNVTNSVLLEYYWYDNLSGIFKERDLFWSETFDILWENGKWEIPLYSVIFLLAIVGNILVILTLAKNSRMRTNTNVFLLNLAISDLVLAVLCMPFTLIGSLLRDFVFGEWMCKLVPFLQATSVAASVWTLVALSIERYYAICHPLRSRRWQTLSHAYHLIVYIWVGGAAVMLPIAVLSELQPTNKGHHKCRESWPNGDYERAYNLFLDLLLLVIPLLALGVTYYLIAITLWRDVNKSSINGRWLNSRCIRSHSTATTEETLPKYISGPEFEVLGDGKQKKIYESRQSDLTKEKSRNMDDTVFVSTSENLDESFAMENVSSFREKLSLKNKNKEKLYFRHLRFGKLRENPKSIEISVLQSEFPPTKNIQNGVRDLPSRINSSKSNSEIGERFQNVFNVAGFVVPVPLEQFHLWNWCWRLIYFFCSPGLRHTNYERSLTKKQRVIKMLFVVVLEFFVCWTPLYVINTLALFWPDLVYGGVGYKMISFCQLLAYTSGCCNPITYCFMNKGFRNSFINLFSCCKNK